MKIPKTDKYLLEHVQSVVSNSHLLKERFKNDVLSSKFDRDKYLIKPETKLEEKCKSLIRRQEQTYENIILMEIDLVPGILKRLRTKLDSLKDEVTKTELEIENLSSERIWLDWVSKYGENLKYKMTDKKNQSFWIKGLIYKIVANAKDGHDRDGNIKQVGHKFDVFFKMKVVKDRLTYIDPNDKSLEYKVTEGRKKSSSDVVNLTKGRGKKKTQMIGTHIITVPKHSVTVV